MTKTHRNRLQRRRGLVAALTMFAAVLGGVLLPAAPSTAAVGAHATTRFIGGDGSVNVRTSTSTLASIAYTLGDGASISIDCQTLGGRLGFSAYADNRTWNRLTDGRYIHDAVTDTPADQGRIYLPDGGYVRYSSNIPRCGNPAPQPTTLQQTAVSNALATVGRARAQETDMAGYFSGSDWQPGPYGEWSFDCAKLVRASYLKAGYSPKASGTATGLWRAYGSPRRSDTPPAGAFIFWPNINHVAISIGGGRFVSTMGREGTFTPNANVAIGQVYGTPTGWAMP